MDQKPHLRSPNEMGEGQQEATSPPQRAASDPERPQNHPQREAEASNGRKATNQGGSSWSSKPAPRASLDRSPGPLPTNSPT